jgi:hypothetical protein
MEKITPVIKVGRWVTYRFTSGDGGKPGQTNTLGSKAKLTATAPQTSPSILENYEIKKRLSTTPMGAPLYQDPCFALLASRQHGLRVPPMREA